MFWFSYCSDRRSSELLETVFEHFVAPNLVVKRGFLAFSEYDPRGRMRNATFSEVRALFLSMQCTEAEPPADAGGVNRVLAHVG